MLQPLRVLEDVRVASPCPAEWNEMAGDDRVRFCGLCAKNVYNLSGMSRAEATGLINAREGEICLRLAQRADGTVITNDCPAGVAALRRRFDRVRRIVAACLALVVWFLTGCSKPAPSAPEPANVPPEQAAKISTGGFDLSKMQDCKKK